MIKTLFVCAQNTLRSPPLCPGLIEWADIIFAMEKAHRDKINKKFKRHLNGKRLG